MYGFQPTFPLIFTFRMNFPMGITFLFFATHVPNTNRLQASVLDIPSDLLLLFQEGLNQANTDGVHRQVKTQVNV